ncbi:CHASE domain-containing protein [Lysobacter sp. A286]
MDNAPGDSPKRSFASRLRPLRGHLLALVVLLASLVSVLLLWRVAYERELRSSEITFRSESNDITELLQQRMINYELVAGGGISLFAVTRPTPEQWASYVGGLELSRRFPSFVGLGFSGYLRKTRMVDLQREWQEAGWGQLDVRPQGARPTYGPILFLEPRTAANVEAIGYDMLSEPTRGAAMTEAMVTGQSALSGPVHLIQDGAAQNVGLLLYVPVYRGVQRPDTPAARRDSMLGWVYIPFRLESLVLEAVGDRQSRFQILDVTDEDVELLYVTPGESSDQAPAFRYHTTFESYGRQWRLEFQSKPVASAVPRLQGLRNMLVFGLLACLLMYGVAWMLARTESRAQSIALRMNENFRRSEERFRTAMAYSAIGKVLLDSHHCIVEANAAFAAIVGRRSEELVGTKLESLLEDEVESGDGATPRHRGDASGVRRETRLVRRADGEPRHVHLTRAPIPGSVGTDIAGLVQAEDVTERLRAEAAVRALNRTLEARVSSRTRELSQVNQELESFAYSVSHDLRAPLRAIAGFSKILTEKYGDQLDEAGQGYLMRTRNAAGRMGELIDALLRMSRLSRSELTIEPVALSQVAAEVIDDLRGADPERKVEVEITPGLRVNGDPSLLRNLLTNLLANAWKFSGDRDLARIQFGREGDEFFVRDNGVGFGQAYVQKLFRPFQRLHAQSAFEGHGIGLASARRIVERHGGTIRAEGREGEGASFYFTLPGATAE